MNANATRTDILLPSNDERGKIFSWLKQVSSYTAWNRILRYYKAWAEAAEASIRDANENGWSELTGIPESDYVLILKGLAHCEEGVRRLRGGDKRVFKYDEHGELVMADRPIDHWSTMLWRLDLGESSISYEHTPHWEIFKATLTRLGEAWSECSLLIIETSDLRDPANNVYGTWLIDLLANLRQPISPTTALEPLENILVKTGKIIPHSGIWEPIHTPKIVAPSIFKREENKNGPFTVNGCMNYLHQGSAAPKALQAYVAEGGFEEPVTWRLLWRDDRYEDGTIPAEESDYVFLQPSTHAELAPKISAPVPSMVWADSDQTSSHKGRWLLESDLTVSIEVQVGDKLPLHQGRPVRWVLAD